MKIALTLSTAAIAVAIALTGCSSEEEAGNMPGMDHGAAARSTSPAQPASASDHNKADTMFAQMMIPHHQQAVEMSLSMLEKKDLDPRVTALAVQIKDAQAPEIEKMTSWLQQWGEPVSHEAAGNHLSGHGGGGHHADGMDGMMSPEQLAALKAATGTEASKTFLTQMIAHHEGAVTMARKETTDGANPEAVALAKAIISAQEAEIQTMKDLHASL